MEDREGRSRGLLLKDGIRREENGKGEEERRGIRRKGGEQPALTIKIVAEPLAMQ